MAYRREFLPSSMSPGYAKTGLTIKAELYEIIVNIVYQKDELISICYETFIFVPNLFALWLDYHPNMVLVSFALHWNVLPDVIDDVQSLDLLARVFMRFYVYFHSINMYMECFLSPSITTLPWIMSAVEMSPCSRHPHSPVGWFDIRGPFRLYSLMTYLMPCYIMTSLGRPNNIWIENQSGCVMRTLSFYSHSYYSLMKWSLLCLAIASASTNNTSFIILH